jgi:hypothetical protein
LLAAENVMDFLFVAKHKLVGLLTDHTLNVMSYEVDYGVIVLTVKYKLEDIWSRDVVSRRLWQNPSTIFIASSAGDLIVIENRFQGHPLGQEL